MAGDTYTSIPDGSYAKRAKQVSTGPADAGAIPALNSAGQIDASMLPGGAVPYGYNYTQTSPSAVWTINHNLGFFPNVQARTVGGALVIVAAVHTSINQVVLSFASLVAGTARCS